MSMETYVTGGGYGDCMRREIATAGILCTWKRMETYVTGGGYGDCMRREIATAGILCTWKRMLREVGMGTV